MAGKSVLFTTQNRADVSSQSDVPQIEKLVDFVTLIFEGPQEYQGLVTIVCGSNKGAMKPVMTVPVHAIEEKLKELVIYRPVTLQSKRGHPNINSLIYGLRSLMLIMKIS